MWAAEGSKLDLPLSCFEKKTHPNIKSETDHKKA
jgi:hypothetical protein